VASFQDQNVLQTWGKAAFHHRCHDALCILQQKTDPSLKCVQSLQEALYSMGTCRDNKLQMELLASLMRYLCVQFLELEVAGKTAA
jgi:hypothetical protein